VNTLTFQGILLSVKKAISKLKSKTKDTNNSQRPYISPYLKILLKEQKGAKYMYKILNKNNEIPTCKITWAKTIPTVQEWSSLDWKNIFSIPFSITKDASIQWFQIRIIHRILGTNSLLYKINYKDAPTCNFCNSEEETIEHLFWQCKIIEPIIKATFKYKNSPMISLDMKKMLFGYTCNTQSVTEKNVLLILAKMYIFSCKTNKTTITANGLKRYFTSKLRILKCSELQKVSLCEFEKKWKPLKHIVNLNEVLIDLSLTNNHFCV
jgi:hypothetical protein